ncbi:MAG: hypothetical protein ACPH5X_07125, partial [Paracoccaceae bacterium]
ASATLMTALQSSDDRWPEGDLEAGLTRLQPGHGFSVPDVTFRKISDEEAVEWKLRFSGGQSAEAHQDI